MIIHTFYKIKEGKRDLWENWCKRIMGEHFNQARSILFEEDVIRERCILFGDYVVYEHHSRPNKNGRLHNNTEKEISMMHNDFFNDCLEFIESGVVGYDLVA